MGKKIWNKDLPKELQPFYGRHHSEETKNKIRLSHIGKSRPKEVLEKLRLSHIGKPLSEEWKEKLRLAGLKRHNSEETRKKIRMRMLGDKNPMFGKHWSHSEESKNKIRLSKIGNKNPMFGKSGELSPTWNGGSSFLPYTPEFNDKLKFHIRLRDNFTCQECGMPEKQLGYFLDVHHMNYNKNNNNVNNLICLCKSCHAQTRFSREEWTEYFQDKLRDEVNGR